MAQDKAVIDQVTKIIQSKTDVDKQLKPIVNANKKNPAMLTAIGRAFLEANDKVNATKYAEMAMTRDKKYAKAYILLGDIAVANEDGGKAAEWYQQAKYFDPKDPEGYYKYALILRGRSPEEAVANLEDLRTHRPDYPVDALAGRIYYGFGTSKMDKAIEYYERVDKTKLEDVDITNYATATWMHQKRDKSLELAKYGLTRDARKAAWNRLAFYNLTDMERTDEALQYADALFNRSDSAKISGYDYTYYGTALKNAKQFDKAIEMFQKAAEANKDNKEQLNMTYKNLSDAYIAMDDFENGTKYYDLYLSGKDKPSAYDIAGLATIYQKMGADKTGDEQAAAFAKADATYAKLAETYPEQIDYANFMRARLAGAMDPDSEKGLAKPFYQAIVDHLATSTTRDSGDNMRLIEAYRYLGSYYYLNKDEATSIANFKKILEINPEDEAAKAALEALGVK
ncbi:MAG: hypothetical protein J5767_14750 [Paludibacteraceae bacterium]|nr:hypothetical protein [Paludibacteraceae bacterium]